MIIPIKLDHTEYDILLERNCLQRASKEINLNRKVLIVTDDGVPVQYVETVATQCLEPVIAVIPQGEDSKSLEQYEKLLHALVDHHFRRTDAIVAIGGGVVGDLAGFAAATYMRGIDFYNIPTTLLAQIDSSVGGKTAINFAHIKNICGAFYQPKKVLIDPIVLDTLPERHFNAGLAEAIKMAATSNARLFSIIEHEMVMDSIDLIIEQSLFIKSSIVEKDEKESNLRKVLNFGHTVGHAIEVQSDYLHGECIGIGMLYFCSDEVREEIKETLEKYNLPTSIDLTVDDLWQAILYDKKAEKNSITIVYVPEIGQFELREVSFDELKEMLKEKHQN